MMSLSDVKQAEIIKAFNSTFRYLDELLNIDNPYFEVMVNRIYPPELPLNKTNTSDTEAPFLNLHLSGSNGFVSSKIYDKRDDFDFHIVNFPFFDGDVPVLVFVSWSLCLSYICLLAMHTLIYVTFSLPPGVGGWLRLLLVAFPGLFCLPFYLLWVYISQLIRFARVSSHVTDFNARNKSLTAKRLQQGYRYHKLRKTFTKFYRRHYELVSKFNVALNTLCIKSYRNRNFMVT